MKSIVVILDNVRSAHNVGSILRTADGLGITEVVMCGITPYPEGLSEDTRLPHIARGADKMIAKTALGAEKSVSWTYEEDIFNAISHFNSLGFHIICLEQADDSVSLQSLNISELPENVVIIVGTEVEGLSKQVLEKADTVVEIDMRGTKESLNVSIAAGIAMYELAKA